jgi:menaquinone-9 beta-reductase
MDDPNLDRDEHRCALNGLRRVNLLSNTASRIAKKIASIAQSMRLESPSILDLGCGSGDVAYGVARRLPKGKAWHLEGWDMSSTAIDYANELCRHPHALDALHIRNPNTSLVFKQTNVFDESTRTFDFVYCSLFLHHFDEQQAIRVLKKMHELARYAVIVDDLDRSRLGWWLARIGVHLLSRSPVVHFDGPQSVLAAFTVDEAKAIASKAGLCGITIEKHWPERWMMTAGRIALSQEIKRERVPVVQDIPALAQQRIEQSQGSHFAKTNMPHASLEHLAQENWDVIVVGAGVAGAAAALLSARRGFKTVLIESKSFPREKVCGGCLNLRAQASLERLGIMDDLLAAGAVKLDRLELRILKTLGSWSIPSLLSIRRSTLDQILVGHAIRAGVVLLSETQAKVAFEDSRHAKPERRQVVLRRGAESSVIHSKIVIVADGLTRSSLRNDSHFQSKIEGDSRVGVQAFLDPSVLKNELAFGTLRMCVANDGYVGLSHTDGGCIDLAAAIDPKSIRNKNSIASVVEKLLRKTIGSSFELPKDLTWRSTPPLTRSSEMVAGDRLLLIGDSIGYVEPFTGEGMSWALASAEAVMPLIGKVVVRGWSQPIAGEWSTWVRNVHFRKQKQCRWMARQLHRPQFAAWILRACVTIPPFRAYLIHKATS